MLLFLRESKYRTLDPSVLNSIQVSLDYLFLKFNLFINDDGVHVETMSRTVWQMFRKATTEVKDQFNDIHARLMKRNYDVVPQWWFILVLVVSFVLALVALEGFDKQLQLPWWGLILACFIALFFTLPIGIIQATTNSVN